mgnify:CR=1 FL=1
MARSFDKLRANGRILYETNGFLSPFVVSPSAELMTSLSNDHLKMK